MRLSRRFHVKVAQIKLQVASVISFHFGVEEEEQKRSTETPYVFANDSVKCEWYGEGLIGEPIP